MKKLTGQIYWIAPSIFSLKGETTKGDHVLQSTVQAATLDNNLLKLTFRYEASLYEILAKVNKGFSAEGKYKNQTDGYEENVFFNFYENPKGVFLVGTWIEGVECTCLIQLFY